MWIGERIQAVEMEISAEASCEASDFTLAFYLPAI